MELAIVPVSRLCEVYGFTCMWLTSQLESLLLFCLRPYLHLTGVPTLEGVLWALHELFDGEWEAWRARV